MCDPSNLLRQAPPPRPIAGLLVMAWHPMACQQSDVSHGVEYGIGTHAAAAPTRNSWHDNGGRPSRVQVPNPKPARHAVNVTLRLGAAPPQARARIRLSLRRCCRPRPPCTVPSRTAPRRNLLRTPEPPSFLFSQPTSLGGLPMEAGGKLLPCLHPSLQLQPRTRCRPAVLWTKFCGPSPRVKPPF